jgi:2-desacetyl-2-hydroxyethyl bacteriochlorophyllide A dehydrogenase
MRIAVLTARSTFEIHEVPMPVLAPDEVLVKVAMCGVCASELEPWDGDGAAEYPLYLGHEVSGTVVDAGPDASGVAVGDPVGVWVTSRGFGEYVAVKAEYCRPAGDVPLDLALAEPLACAVNAVDLADVRLGDDVVLIGAGFMGNLVHELVALRGVRSLVVADTRPDALEKASELGATRVVRVPAESLPDVVAEVTEGRGADVTFECTGTQGGLAGVGDVTRMSGKVVLVGYHQGKPREIPLGYWNWMAFQIVNAHFRDVSTIMRGMSVGMRLVTSGRLSLEGLVTHGFTLEQINDAFATAVAKPDGFVKATVVLDDPASATER